MVACRSKQGLRRVNRDLRIKEVTVENLLRGCSLHTAREPRPGTRGVNGVRNPFPFRRRGYVYSVKWIAKMRQLQCPDKGRGGKSLDLELGPRHGIDTITVQNLLRNRVLNTARQTRPSTSCIHSVGESLSLGSKPNKLFEHGLVFFVHSTARLEYN